jgi:hypothetical protein
MFGVLVPAVVAVISSAAIEVLLLIFILAAIIGVARWAKRRTQ